jgi:hypothetical protein
MPMTGTPAENEPERRARTLRVVVSGAEASRIAAQAKRAGLSVSHYLRNLGLGHQPKSRLDRELVLELIKINADQGRLGGLLKWWLSARPGEGAPAFDVRKLLREIEAAQAQLKQTVERL